MNDRTGASMAAEAPELMDIERVVGALSQLRHGRPPAEIVRGFMVYSEQIGQPTPPWLTEAVVEAAAERMRQLEGQWRATGFGEAMELLWPASS